MKPSVKSVSPSTHTHDANNRRYLIRYFLVAAMLATICCSPTPAQNLCSDTPTTYPCVDRPKTGDTYVTGKLGKTPENNAAIVLKVDNNTPPGISTTLNTDGTFKISGLSALKKDSKVNVTQTVPPAAAGVAPATRTTGDVSVVDDPDDSQTTVILIAGWEQAGYSSLAQYGNPFVNVFIEGLREHTISAWGRVRLLSAPQPATQGIVSTFADPTGQITTKSFSDVGQAMDFLIGPRLNLGPHWSAIAEFGATTPLSSQNVAVSYVVPPQGTAECTTLGTRFSSANGYNPGLMLAPAGAGTCLVNGYKDIAFSNQDRSNFYLKYGAGFRTSYPFKCNGTSTGKSPCSPAYGVLDLTLGQDESVTGGYLRSVVFKMDGILPIQLGDASWLYVFGSVYMRLNRNQDLSPLILTTATGLTIPSPTVAVLPLRQPNRDYYRLGVGINLSQVFCKFSTSACANKGTGDTKNPASNKPQKAL